ncbi:hypothetical protein [Streptomyces sp. NPDC057509]|uniref:hypothetical protein n=1 Tax=Streptomyces sp. NPDC057509 TaxID=3346152 RepID=UPI00368B8733
MAAAGRRHQPDDGEPQQRAPPGAGAALSGPPAQGGVVRGLAAPFEQLQGDPARQVGPAGPAHDLLDPGVHGGRHTGVGGLEDPPDIRPEE